MPCWIDTHCHLDAPEFAADLPAVRQQARALGVRCCVIAAVSASTFDEARQAAHRLGDAYALGTHPLYVPQAGEGAAQQLAAALQASPNCPTLKGKSQILPIPTADPIQANIKPHFDAN